jgi:Tol biopolymer transport system component
MIVKGWKIKFRSLLICSLGGIFMLFLFPFSQFYNSDHDEALAATELKKPDYYPLAVGNQWEFNRQHFKEDEKKLSRHSTTIITGKSDIGNGMIQYYTEGGKEFLIKAKEGILTSSGIFLLKYPLTEGASWISGQWNYDQRLFKVEKVGFSITLSGRKYDNCIKITVTSDFHATLRKDRETEYVAFESYHYYAPNVGPVLTETFEIKKSGKRTPISRTELVKFETSRPVPESKAEILGTKEMVGPKESFRFPEKGFIHPILSPDDKWLIYQRTEKVWKELYYTELGKKYEKIVPVCQAGEEKSIRGIGIGKWSPDGRVLAVQVDSEYGNQIVLVDFSRDQPFFMESLGTDDSSFGKCFYWSLEGFIVYLGKRGTIMKKFPRKQPDEFTLSTVSFQVASGGLLLYGAGNRSVYLANLQKSSTRTRIFPDLRIDSFDLSPNGEYALLYDLYSDQNNRLAMLANLKTLQIKNKWLIRSEPWLEAKWSPDGSKLAYLEKTFPQKSKDDPSKTVWPNPHFFVLDLGTGKTQDYGIGVSKDFSWTPDGRHIIYSMKYAHDSLGMYHNGIFIMRVSDGQEIGQLTKVSAHLNLTMSPSCKYIVWQALNMDTFFVAENPFRSRMSER